MPPPSSSRNFAFLAAHDERLAVLGTQAERLFADDPNAALTKLRLFAELLAQRAAASSGLYSSYQENQSDLLGRLAASRVITREVAESVPLPSQGGQQHQAALPPFAPGSQRRAPLGTSRWIAAHFEASCAPVLLRLGLSESKTPGSPHAA